MPLLKFAKKEEVPADKAESALALLDGSFVVVEETDTSTLQTELTDWKKKHTDLQKANKVVTDTAAELQRKLEAKDATHGETDKKMSDLLTKWEADAKTREKAAADAVRAELQPFVEKTTKYELDNALIAAFTKAGGRPEKANTMLKIAKGDWSLVDGKPVIKDKDGNPTTKSLDEYYSKDYKTAEPEQYAGSKGGGGGQGGMQTAAPSVPGGFDIANPGASLRASRAEGKTE